MAVGWTEEDSQLFIDEGAYYVPERERQLRIICDLIPPSDGAVDIIELCCGEGLLTHALLEAFPKARVHAYDGSPAMLQSTADKAGPHAVRLTTQRFDLAATDWRAPDFRAPNFHAHGVVSSLAVHHLDGREKQALFRDLFALLAPGGVFVLADLIAPARPAGVTVAAAAWDEEVRERAMALDGNLAAFERFRNDDWNHYSADEPDPVDKPSALLDQLKWLEAAGFKAVDLHWMKAGHVILSAAKSIV